VVVMELEEKLGVVKLVAVEKENEEEENDEENTEEEVKIGWAKGLEGCREKSGARI